MIATDVAFKESDHVPGHPKGRLCVIEEFSRALCS
jgi:hypothetical protein